jgi:BR serine/threonine kinase
MEPMAEETGHQFGDYVILKTIGAGTTGKVKLARNSATGQLVAIKVIKKAHFAERPNLRGKIDREIALLRILDHPHILKLIDVLDSPYHLHLVLEFAQRGELFEYLVRTQTLREDTALEIFRQLIYGLEYLHSHSICHRDLKPENILLDANGQVRIADFGFARWMRESVAETSCGSPHYAAPEVLRGVKYDGCAADIWSAGVILYALLSGTLPFDDPSIRNLMRKVKRGKFVMPDFHFSLKDLISKMLTVDPASRIRIADIKKHDAFRMNLPPHYVVPRPIPLRNIEAPIDPHELPDDVRRHLAHIGVDAEFLERSLLAEEGNDLKMFVMMLIRKTQLEELPWEEGFDSVRPETVAASAQTEWPEREFVAHGLTRRDRRTESMDAPTPQSLSVPVRQAWIAYEPVVDYDVDDMFGPAEVPLCQLMADLQGVLIRFGFVLFHRNDLELLGNKGHHEYCEIKGFYASATTIVVVLKMINGLQDYEALADEIRGALRIVI